MKKLKPEQIYGWVTREFPDNKPRKGGDEIRINNPFREDSGYHFNISCTKALCHDWRGDEWVGSGPGGRRKKCTFLKFVQLYKNCSFFDAVRSVLGASSDPRLFLRVQKTSEEQEATDDTSLGLPDASESLLDSSQPKLASTLLKWLASRGIDERRVEKYGMLHSGFDVIWPYYEYDEIVYWQSRSRLNKTFMFPPLDTGVNRNDYLYGFDQVEPASHVIIVESIIDGQTLEDQCVASGGAILGDMQVRKIRVFNPKDGIILAPDNDEAGIKSILSNAAKLQKLGHKLYYALPPKYRYVDGDEENETKDWNDVAKYVCGWDKVLDVLNDSVVQLTFMEKKKLTGIVDRLSSKSIATPKPS